MTFRYEMRQVYRVAGTDLDVPSLQANLSVNRSERPQDGGTTYLGLLGLAVPTDQNVFDRENRLFPRTRDPDAAQVLRESYIVFPMLTPFADPRLSPAERTDSLYRTPLFLLLNQGPPTKFQVRLRYNSTGAGDRSTLSLGALQIRDGSEQLSLGGRRLERGVDYTISYELGQVTFLNPESLFGHRGGADHCPLRGAGHIRHCSNDHPWAHHQLPAGRCRCHQFNRGVSAGAERFQPSSARLRGIRQSGGRHQHRASLQAGGPEPAAQRADVCSSDGAFAVRPERRGCLYQAGSQPLGAGLPRGVRGRSRHFHLAPRNGLGVRGRSPAEPTESSMSSGVSSSRTTPSH